MARDLDRHVAEVQIRIVVIHDYVSLGTPVSESVV